MAERTNQHFVPQHHLRLYAAGRRYLSVAIRSRDLVVARAAIRGQCARHNYYGDDAIERALSELEARHAPAFRAAQQHAWSNGPALTVMQRYRVREALLLQRNRTPRHAMQRASSMAQFATYGFREYLGGQAQIPNRRVLRRSLDTGEITVQPDETLAVRLGIQTSMQLVPLIKDLGFHLLRNRTSLPFLLGDSPCIFSNHHKRAVRGMGVTGLASRGLMIAMPLDSRTYVLMLDTAVYHPLLPSVVDVENSGDVQILNALQAYEAVDCVYFDDFDHADYARQVVIAHQKPEAGGFQVLRSVPSSGNRRVQEILQVYEPPSPISLDLSFIRADELQTSESLNQRRNAALMAEFSADTLDHEAGSSMPIEELVEWVLPRLVPGKQPRKPD